MADDSSMDLTGVGKLAQAIPASAWSEVVHTACDTFSKFLAPIIETTSGIGRLIQAKFDRFVEAEKVLAADLVVRASQKARASRKRSRRPAQAPIILVALEHGATQTDETLRELWSNLLAQELATGSVHPEFPTILSKLSAAEALILAEVAQSGKDKSRKVKAFVASLTVSVAGFGVSLGDLSRDPYVFEHEHLRLLNLIENRGGVWWLTLIGEEFIGAVSDPSFMKTAPNPGPEADG